jgi:hypothetical protein
MTAMARLPAEAPAPPGGAPAGCAFGPSGLWRPKRAHGFPSASRADERGKRTLQVSPILLVGSDAHRRAGHCMIDSGTVQVGLRLTAVT